jgi:hypothetical protein
MDGVQPLGRGEGVRELAPDLGDLPHRHEGGQGEERRERDDARVQRAMRGQDRARDGTGETAHPGGDLLQGALPREVPEERHPRLRVDAGARRELRVPARLLLECGHFREPLDRVDHMRVE